MLRDSSICSVIFFVREYMVFTPQRSDFFKIPLCSLFGFGGQEIRNESGKGLMRPWCRLLSPLVSFSLRLCCFGDKAFTAYGMEISAEKTKLMTNNTSGINTEIKLNEQKLKTVTSFKGLGSVITDVSSKPEILSRIT